MIAITIKQTFCFILFSAIFIHERLTKGLAHFLTITFKQRQSKQLHCHTNNSTSLFCEEENTRWKQMQLTRTMSISCILASFSKLEEILCLFVRHCKISRRSPVNANSGLNLSRHLTSNTDM